MAKDYDIAKKTVQDEMKEILEGLNTTLSGTLTASAVKRVQRGSVAMKSNTNTYDIAIQEVDTAKTFVNVQPHPYYTSSGGVQTNYGVSGQLLNSTTLRIFGSGVSDYTALYEVVEFY